MAPVPVPVPVFCPGVCVKVCVVFASGAVPVRCASAAGRLLLRGTDQHPLNHGQAGASDPQRVEPPPLHRRIDCAKRVAMAPKRSSSALTRMKSMFSSKKQNSVVEVGKPATQEPAIKAESPTGTQAEPAEPPPPEATAPPEAPAATSPTAPSTAAASNAQSEAPPAPLVAAADDQLE